MSKTRVPGELREFVATRARNRCEYCRLHEDDSGFVHEVDHIRAEKHGGKTVVENLAYACRVCNNLKGSDVGSFDPVDDTFHFFFNPRIQAWETHFAIRAQRIVGLTPVGRVTVNLFRIGERPLTERQLFDDERKM